MNFTANQLAFKQKTVPNDPLPFLQELLTSCKENKEFMRSHEAKMLLFTLIRMAYGEHFFLDSTDEKGQLNKYIKNDRQPAAHDFDIIAEKVFYVIFGITVQRAENLTESHIEEVKKHMDFHFFYNRKGLEISDYNIKEFFDYYPVPTR